LSYTAFRYRSLEISSPLIGPEEDLVVSAEVENVGEVAGDEVVQLYVSLPDSPFPAPIRQLQGFARLHLLPGEAKRIDFVLSPRQRAVVNDSGRWIVPPGKVEIFLGGRQPRPGERGSGEGEVLYGTVLARN
jgi:beta-glucosidase